MSEPIIHQHDICSFIIARIAPCVDAFFGVLVSLPVSVTIFGPIGERFLVLQIQAASSAVQSTF